MKSISLFCVAFLCTIVVKAQETYQSAALTDYDLNGTARYVGMGGAMEALGADISTIGSNPAGIGFFRTSQVTVSGGLNISGKPSKTSASFDQVGAVFSLESGYDSYVNFGVNCKKSTNFNNILSACNSLNGASQNKISYLKGYLGCFEIDYDNLGNLVGWQGKSDNPAKSFSQIDYLYYNNFLFDAQKSDETGYTELTYEDAQSFNYENDSRGGIYQYDFNLSTNIRNRFYLGVTVGVSAIDYHSDVKYTEKLISGSDVTLYDSRDIKGSGINLKMGAIFRPVETSSFRVGAYVHTPTWYKLTTSNSTALKVGSEVLRVSENYDFRLYTPWVFGVSMGHVFGSVCALGVTYEYSDFSSLDNRIYRDGYYGYDNYNNSESYSDYEMNKNTKDCLKGQHTIKVGAEVRVNPMLSLRAGYNYLSPKYRYNSENAWKDSSKESYGSFYSSTTDYTNWKDTHRLTCGLGIIAGSGITLDLAYQYSTTRGEFFPFMSYYDDGDPGLDCVADVTNVSKNRHQVLLTLGYRF